MKKRKLLFMFLRRWLISLAIVFAIIEGVYYLIYEVYTPNMTALYYNNIIRDKLLKNYIELMEEGYEGDELVDRLEESSRILVARLGLYGYARVDELNSNKVLAESQNVAAIVIKNGSKVDYYFCEDYDLFREMVNEYRKYVEYGDLYAWSMFMNFEDIYVKGNEFYPGIINVKNFDKKGDLSKSKKYDLAKKVVPEGYEHITISDKEQEIIFCDIEDSENVDILREWCNTNYEILEGSEDAVDAVGSGNVDRCIYCAASSHVTLGDLCIKIAVSSEVVTKLQLKMWNLLRMVVFVIDTLFSFFAAYIKYYKLKKKYEMNEYKKTMTLAMAHELKTPLMAISGYAESMKEIKSEEKREEYSASIFENVSLMNQIIVNILELSKLENVKKTTKQDEINIYDIVEEELKKYQYLLERKGLNVNISGSFIMHGDAEMIKLAVANMINNAIKYSKDSTGIDILLNDTGITIRNEYKKYRDKQGTGVGLEVVKAVASIHNMKYEAKEVESDEKNKRSFEASLSIK